MPRTRTDEMQALAIEDLAASLETAGLRIEQAGKRSLKVRLDDARFDLDIIPAAYATGACSEVDARRPLGNPVQPVLWLGPGVGLVGW